MGSFDSHQLRIQMVQRKQTLAVAESLTCGNIQAAVGAASGASDFFQGGVTTYNLEQKVRLLNVGREHAESVNCVSETVALEMARGVAELYRSDFGISSTGYAEPWPEGAVECPYAFVAIWYRAGALEGRTIACSRIDAPGMNRVEVQHHVTNAVLSGFSEWLESLESTDE